MKTKFVNGVNPFTGKKEAEELSVCNDPIPESRAKQEGKYEHLLSKMKPGQAIKCPPNAVGRIANAAKKYAKTHHPGCIVRSTQDYGDGMGRVWIIKP